MALTTIKNLNLASSVTGTLPVANGGTGLASGTADQYLKFTGTTTLASAGVDAGKIGQVTHTKNTTYTTVSSSTLVEVMNVAITPSATSSKILVLCSAHIGKGTNNTSVIERMFRVVGGSDVATQVLSDIAAYTDSTAYNEIGSSGTQFYDTPNTTSAITYSYRISSYENNAIARFNNYQAGGSFSSQMTAMEILA
jgi:hypothetical protein